MKQIGSFSYKEALKSSFNRVIDNFSTFGYLGLLWIAIQSLFGVVFLGLIMLLMLSISKEANLASVIAGFFGISSYALYYIIVALITPYMHFQFLHLAMDLQKGKEISVRRAFSYDLGLFLRYLLPRFLRGVKIFLGTLLFFFPGIYFGLKNYFAGFSILEKPETSLSEDTGICHILTNKVKWKLLLVGWLKVVFLTLPLGIASIFFPPLAFGYIFISPFSALIDVDIYLQLKKARLE